MSITRFIDNPGRTLAYSPVLAHLFKDVNASLFYCQMLFWHGKGKLADNWIYKESKDITRETGLTYEQQRTVRNKLKKWRLLEEKRKRREGHIQYRVDPEHLKSIWRWLEENSGQSLANSAPEDLHRMFLKFLEVQETYYQGIARSAKSSKTSNRRL